MIDIQQLRRNYELPPAVQRHLRINFVSSADGAATVAGRSGKLGNESDRALMRVLRETADAVMVGAGTVRAEGYGGLNLPDEARARRRQQGLTSEPRIIVVSDHLRLNPDMSVFTKPEERTLIITSEVSDQGSRDTLEEVADVWVCGQDTVNLPQALNRLDDEGYSRMLCEGGPHLFGSLLETGSVDEVCLTLAPIFVAGHATRISVTQQEHLTHMRLKHALEDEDGTLLLRYMRSQ